VDDQGPVLSFGGTVIRICQIIITIQVLVAGDKPRSINTLIIACPTPTATRDGLAEIGTGTGVDKIGGRTMGAYPMLTTTIIATSTEVLEL
jgi:hypothetical protein